MAQGFFTPDEMATPDDIEYRKKLAQSLMGQGMSAEPIKHWTQGAARLAQAMVGAGWQEQARADAQGLRDYEAKQLSEFLGNPSGAPSSASTVVPPKPAPSQAMTTADATPKAGMSERMTAAFGDFRSLFPNVAQTSGFRTPAQNAAAGGAPQSAHLDGNAMDFSLKGLDDAQKKAVVEWWRNQGATGIGYYPDKDSLHVDFKPGGNRAWGPNYSYTSLPQTPEWFQTIGNQHRGGNPVQVASAAPMAYGPSNAPIQSAPLPAPQAIASALTSPNAPYAGSLVGMNAAPANPQGFGMNAFGGAQPPPQAAPEPAPKQVAQALTGQPAPAAAAPAPQTVAPPATQSSPNLERLLNIMKDPRISKETRQTAMTLYQLSQKDQGVTPVDLGDRIALMNKNGQVTGYLPKSEKPVLVGEGQTLRDPRTGATIGAEPKPKIEREVAEREQLVRERGMDPNDSRVRQFVLTGTYPKDPELTATDRTAILEADELVSSNRSLIDQLKKAKEVSPKAYGNAVGNYASSVGAVLGDEASKATVDLNNIVAGNALSSLKTIFGGNPTEGERKILLDLQGSGSQPDEIRQKIYDRAIEAAQKRLQFNQQRADQLRGGTFYKPGGNTPPAQLAPDPLGIR